MKVEKFKYIFFLCFFSIFSFFSFFYILNISSKNIEKIYILPLFYGFILIIFNKLLIRIFNSKVFTFLIFGYFFKMVIMPIFLVLGDNYSLIQNISVESNLELAFKLMIYEWFGICFFLYVNYKNSISLIKEIHNEDFIQKKVLFILLFIISSILLFFPQVLAYSFSILDFDNSRHFKIKIMQENVPKIVYVMYIYSFDYLKYFLPVYLILKIELIKDSIYLKKILLLFIVILLFLLSGSTLADTIFSVITIIIIITDLYIRYKKIFYTFIFISIGNIICLLLFRKGLFILERLNIFSYISLILQAYFGGPMNVATAISINKELLNINILKADFLKSIFILAPLFKGEISTVKLFNYTLYKNFDRADQIIPMIGQAYFYVGFILSPLLIYPIIKMSIFFEKMANRSTNLYSRFLFLSLTIFLSVSPILYNFNIVLSKLFVLSPLILLSLKNRKRVKNV